jgi:hypothetical protein
MLALADYEADLCSCGGLFSETSDPANEFAYVADGPYRCHRCTALAEGLDAAQKAGGEIQHPQALHWTVVKR